MVIVFRYRTFVLFSCKTNVIILEMITIKKLIEIMV